jgi:hypothetical protein
MDSGRRGQDREMNLALRLGADRTTGPLMEGDRRGEDREMNLALRPTCKKAHDLRHVP